MNARPSERPVQHWLWAVCSTALTLCACSDSRLQPKTEVDTTTYDNLLSIRTDYCVQRDATVEFPVKVLFVVDQSASLQCTDPANRRAAALNDSVNDILRNRSAQVGVLGFSSWARELDFTRDNGAVLAAVDPAGGLGPATDYQGALATAFRMLEQDILATPEVERARTRYVVVYVSDGVAEPRCNAGCEDDRAACSDGVDNDADGFVDGADQDCANIDDNSLHPDNLYGICNTTQAIPDDLYVDFDGVCPAYNQPLQIQQRVADMLELQDIYNIGGVTLNSVYLFAPASEVEAVCGSVSETFGYNSDQARTLLRGMASAGNGVFRDINLATADGDNFLRFDFRSLQAPQWLVSMAAWNVHARLGPGGLEPDTDMDGVPDSVEQSMGTDFRGRDSDTPNGDRYGDLFELRNLGSGFDPSDPTRPAVSCPDGEASDLDGDGLLDCEEVFAGTDPRHPDTDSDGIMDWFEVVMQTDPLVADAEVDLDFDGISNRDEILGGSDPVQPDPERYRDTGMQYSFVDVGPQNVAAPDANREDLRQCYEVGVDRIQLVTTPLVPDRGLNRILLYALEEPAQLAGARAAARVACLEAFYRGPQSKDPVSGELDLRQQAWLDTLLGVQEQIDDLQECNWFDQTFDRGALAQKTRECLPYHVRVGDFAYDPDQRVQLVRKYVASNMSVSLPRLSSELFVPIENFNPDNHCYRPWELDYLSQLFGHIMEECNACTPERTIDGQDGEPIPNPCCAAP